MFYKTEVVIGIYLDLIETPRDVVRAKFRRIMDLPFNPAETRNGLIPGLDVDNLATLWVTIKEVKWPEARTKLTTEKTGSLPHYIMQVEWRTRRDREFDAVLNALKNDLRY